MSTTPGGCYCGDIRYSIKLVPVMKGQCHCRECQYLSGGAPQLFIAQPKTGFQYTQGTPKSFTRSDLENPVTRDFCGKCGTQLVTHRPQDGVIIVKVGTLDNPPVFGGPRVAIYTCDKQDFHIIPDGMPAFDKLPDTP